MRGLYFAITACFVLICVTAETPCGGEFDWKCKTGGGCIRDDYVCDRQEDCLDGSDEANCTMDGQFNCMDGGGFLKEEYVCDGETDCENGADEMNCTCDSDSRNWKCKTGGGCIDSDYICDGEKNCWDGSDEMNCTCDFENGIWADFDWKCKTGGWCTDSYQVCDGVKDCWDGSDELNCSCDPGSLRPFQCKKANGTPYCIYGEQICNGKRDCPDGSDETNCHKPGRTDKPKVTASDNEVKLQWTAPDAGPAGITNYDVEYRLNTAQSWVKPFIGENPSTFHTFRNLPANKEYVFRVSAANLFGVGEPSEPTEPVLIRPKA